MQQIAVMLCNKFLTHFAPHLSLTVSLFYIQLQFSLSLSLSLSRTHTHTHTHTHPHPHTHTHAHLKFNSKPCWPKTGLVKNLKYVTSASVFPNFEFLFLFHFIYFLQKFYRPKFCTKSLSEEESCQKVTNFKITLPTFFDTVIPLARMMPNFEDSTRYRTSIYN